MTSGDSDEFQPNVRNMSFKVVGRGVGQRLVITIDLSRELGTSGTGRSIMVATSGGLIRLKERPEIRLNLNVFKPKSAIRRKLREERKGSKASNRNRIRRR